MWLMCFISRTGRFNYTYIFLQYCFLTFNMLFWHLVCYIFLGRTSYLLFFTNERDGLGHFVVRHYIGGAWYFNK
jgi:hypothetical protein